MGEAHSFVSFFASFFLKAGINILLQKAYQHCILLNKSFVMKRGLSIFVLLERSGSRLCCGATCQEYFQPSVHLGSLTSFCFKLVMNYSCSS